MVLRKWSELDPAQQAGIMCNEPRFQSFVADRLGLHGSVNASAAAAYLRDQCDVGSRRELETDPRAQARFDALCTEFDAWRGKIAKPNEGQ